MINFLNAESVSVCMYVQILSLWRISRSRPLTYVKAYKKGRQTSNTTQNRFSLQKEKS